MKEEIIQKAYSLNEELKNDERVIRLNRLENELNNNDEVMALAYAKDVKADNYSEMVRLFKDESEEANRARIALAEAKTKLDTHPLVKEYLKAYQVVRDLYNEINAILFNGFNPSICPKEKKQWESLVENIVQELLNGLMM